MLENMQFLTTVFKFKLQCTELPVREVTTNADQWDSQGESDDEGSTDLDDENVKHHSL